MTDSAVSAKKVFFRKADFILLACCIALGVILLLFSLRLYSPGTTVTVTVDGQPWGSWPLSTDAQIDIDGIAGQNRLVISDGSAAIVSADCPDLICVRHLPISRNGERIVCLPNRVIVSIEADEPSESLDAVSQ